MQERKVEEEFASTRGFALLMGCNQVLREAMTVYMTDPKTAGMVSDVIAECLRNLEAILPPQEGQGINGGPNCPVGTEEKNGRCVPIL